MRFIGHENMQLLGCMLLHSWMLFLCSCVLLSHISWLHVGYFTLVLQNGVDRCEEWGKVFSSVMYAVRSNSWLKLQHSNGENNCRGVWYFLHAGHSFYIIVCNDLQSHMHSQCSYQEQCTGICWNLYRVIFQQLFRCFVNRIWNQSSIYH
jgi:hypothetical protein